MKVDTIIEMENSNKAFDNRSQSVAVDNSLTHRAGSVAGQEYLSVAIVHNGCVL